MLALMGLYTAITVSAAVNFIPWITFFPAKESPDACGGIIKPDVVLYEEGLDDSVLSRSIQHIRNADVLIIGGTSLVVYPAAGLIDYYRGNKLVLINKSATSRDSQADLVICGSVGEALAEAAEL